MYLRKILERKEQTEAVDYSVVIVAAQNRCVDLKSEREVQRFQRDRERKSKAKRLLIDYISRKRRAACPCFQKNVRKKVACSRV